MFCATPTELKLARILVAKSY